MEPRVTTFLDTAFGYQIGQFYPERHEENLKKLSEQFNDYDSELIDCLYRYSILLGSQASSLAEKVYHRYLSEEEALSHLAVEFKSFSKGTRDWALENALDVYTVTKDQSS